MCIEVTAFPFDSECWNGATWNGAYDNSLDKINSNCLAVNILFRLCKYWKYMLTCKSTAKTRSIARCKWMHWNGISIYRNRPKIKRFKCIDDLLAVYTSDSVIRYWCIGIADRRAAHRCASFRKQWKHQNQISEIELQIQHGAPASLAQQLGSQNMALDIVCIQTTTPQRLHFLIKIRFFDGTYFTSWIASVFAFHFQRISKVSPK